MKQLGKLHTFNWHGLLAAPKPRTLLVRGKGEWLLACDEHSSQGHDKFKVPDVPQARLLKEKDAGV